MSYLLIASNVIMTAAFILVFNHLPLQIPLFYSSPMGEDQLAEAWMIFLLPVFMNLFFLINEFVSKKIFADNPFILKVVYYLNISVIITLTFIFLKIIILIS